LKFHFNIILPSKPRCPLPTETLHASILSPCVLHTPPFSFFSFSWMIFGEKSRILSSLLCSFLHSPVTSFLLGPNIHLSTIFSNTFSLRSSLNVSDLVSHPYKKQTKFISVYLKNYNVFGWQTWRQTILQTFLKLNLLWMYSWLEFWFVSVISRSLNCSTLSKDSVSIFRLWFWPACWSRDMAMFLVFLSICF
jgi:hypothetical protein